MAGNFQSWDYDAPSGTYKSHALTQEVLHASIAKTQFVPVFQPIDSYGKRRGDTVTVPRFSNLTVPTTGRLGENEDIPEDVVSQSTTSTTVTEWGRSIPFSSFNRDLSPLDLPMALRKELEKQMRLTLDIAAAAKLKENQIKYIPTGVAAGTFDTDGTASSAAGSNLNFYHLERIRDYMVADLRVDMFEDGGLKGYVGTTGLRGLKNDPKFETWNAPQNREAKVRGMVGRIEGIDIIEVNHEGASSATAALDNDLGTNGVLGEAIFVAPDAAYTAIVEDPQILVAKLDAFGRRHGIAWYGIMEFGLFWDGDSANAGEAKIVHVTSS